MYTNEIKKNIIKKISVVSVILFVLVVILIIFYNYFELKNKAFESLHTKSVTLIALFKSLDGNYSNNNIEKLEKMILQELKPTGIDYVEFYSTDFKELTNIKKLNQRYDIDNKEELLRFSNNGQISLYQHQPRYEIALPIKIDTYLIGYVVMSYNITDMIDTMVDEIVSLIIFTAAIIFILTILLVPIIFKLNDSLLFKIAELKKSHIDTIMTLGEVIAKRDSNTGAHNYRVTIYAHAIATKLNLTVEEKMFLMIGSFLHDIGKIAIRDDILLKPTKLNEEEFEIMKTHVIKGMEIIKNLGWIRASKDVVLCHHEKYDGSGYPKGLRGNDIPVNARIFAIADVFDALTSKRPYKEAFSYEKSIEIIVSLKNTHFDPIILEEFLSISQTLYNDIKFKDEEELKKILFQKIF